METIKSYTDIEQSRKLAEILPLESADMIYIMYRNGEKPQNGDANLSTVYESNEHNWYWIDIIDGSWDMRIGEDIPCWSLAALLSVLPTIDDRNAEFCKDIRCDKWHIYYHGTATLPIIDTDRYENPVDACYEMIIRLNELKIL